MWSKFFVEIFSLFRKILKKLYRSVTGGHRHKLTKIKDTNKGTRSLLLSKFWFFKVITIFNKIRKTKNNKK